MSKAFQQVLAHQLAAMGASDKLKPLDKSEWPSEPRFRSPSQVWVSRKFLVQLYEESDGQTRLSVTKCKVGNLSKGRTFDDGISWDALQAIKSEVGLGNRIGVEIYPEDGKVVNVANMRHLWVFPEGDRLSCAW